MSILNKYKRKDFTWKRGESESQIDNIWMPSAIITTATYPKIEEVISTKSDHRMVMTEMEVKELDRKRRKKQKRKIFMYKKTEEEKWVNFKKEVKEKIEKLEIKSIVNEETLNKAWHKWNLAIKQAANKNIKSKHRVIRTFNARTKKASLLHKALVKINKVIKELETMKHSSSMEETLERINKKLEKVRELIQCERLEIRSEDLDVENLASTKGKIKEVRRLIHKCRQEENKSEIREEIANAIDRRENNFQKDTKKMIDSILKRRRARIEIENIRRGDELLIEEEEIKEEVRRHFKNWTKRNESDQKYWETWKAEYEPKQENEEKAYEELLKSVEKEEFQN